MVASLALLLTGCIWTRLLSFKNQLAELDRYVRVEERDGLTLHFNQPVLYADDVLFLMELEPTRRLTNGAKQTWQWTFRKLHSATNSETGDYDLTFATTFVSNRLAAFSFGERLLVSFPKQLILGALNSLGHADIDQQKRSATVHRWVDRGGVDKEWQSLTRASVTNVLGQPFRLTCSNEISTLLYRYQLDSPSLKSQNPMRVNAAFSFRDATSKLARLHVNYAGFKINYEPNNTNAPAPAKKP